MSLSVVSSKTRPSFPPTKKDWIKHSPAIARLYKVHTLNVVMDMMVQQFGFRATQRMYKARLPNLGVRKYGQSKPNLPRSLGNDPSSSVSNIEMIVFNVRRYAELDLALTRTSHLSLSSVGQGRMMPVPDDVLWQELDTGLALLEQGARLPAFASLEAACQMVRQVLLSQPPLLFRGIVMVFGTDGWHAFQDVRAALVRYFARMAFYVFGPHHPAFHILKMIYRDTEILQSSSEFSLRCLLEFLGKTLPPLDSEVLRTKRDLSIVLRRQKQLDSAEEMMRQTVNDCEARLSLVDVETLRCLRRLASLHMHRNKYDEAEELLIESIRRAGRPDNSSGPSMDDTDTFIYAQRDLALIAMQQNDMTKCRIRLQQFASVCESKLSIVNNRPFPLLPEELTLVGAEMFVKDMVIAYNLHCDELASKFMSQTPERASGQRSQPS